MSHATGSPCDAASVLFDLPGYRVVEAVDRPGGVREVTVAATSVEEACLSWGTLAQRVPQRMRHRLTDGPAAGRAEGCWSSAASPAGNRRVSGGPSPRSPISCRRGRGDGPAAGSAARRCRPAGRVVAEVAAGHGVSWWTVQRPVLSAADLLTDPDTCSGGGWGSTSIATAPSGSTGTPTIRQARGGGTGRR